MLRKFFLVPVLAVALFAGGCAGGIPNPFKVISALTTPINNPITPKMLDNAQNTLKVAIDGLNIYGNLCATKRLVQTCWDVIESIQVYTKQLPPLLANARLFVRNNDQVNARTAYDAVQKLLSDIRRESLANGVI